MAKEKIDQVLEEIGLMKEDIGSLKEGQQRNYDSIRGNYDSTQRNYNLIQKNGVKIEQVAMDVKAVAEGHQVIRSEMRQMEQRLGEKIGENKSAIGFVAKQLGDKIDKVNQNLEEHMRVPHAV